MLRSWNIIHPEQLFDFCFLNFFCDDFGCKLVVKQFYAIEIETCVAYVKEIRVRATIIILPSFYIADLYAHVVYMNYADPFK